jgi:pantetheine-phosphate adenylyltransferase
VRVAVYAGTFDPITRGHLSVIERAAQIFDRVIVLLAVNPGKAPLFSVEERVAMISEAIAGLPTANVTAASTDGFVVDFARAAGALFLVRGVRSGLDVEGEIALANMNHQLAPEVSTVFVPAHPALSEVSSSRLKELARQGADLSPYCLPGVAERLAQRFTTTTPEVSHAR